MPERHDDKYRGMVCALFLNDDFSRAVNHIFHGSTLSRSDEIGDVVNEAMVKLLECEGVFDPNRGRFFSWALTIVYRKGITRIRQERSRNCVLRRFNDVLASETVSISERQAEANKHIIFREAISQLDPINFQIIELQSLQRLSCRVIAKILDISVGTVYSRGSRARERLREILRCSIFGESSTTLEKAEPPPTG